MEELESKYKQAMEQILHLLDAQFTANAKIAALTAELEQLKQSKSATDQE